MRRQTLREEYFSWLYSRIEGKKPFVTLCRLLHSKVFRWFIHNDDNRCEDGIQLRYVFCNEKGLDEDHVEVEYFLKGDCTIFELLVALAIRMNDLMYDLKDQENKTPVWFGRLLRNLKLTQYSDLGLDKAGFLPMEDVMICDTLEIFMDRTYEFNGKGGLFPLKRHPPEDQRTVEIWYQMMAWLDENYG